MANKAESMESKNIKDPNDIDETQKNEDDNINKKAEETTININKNENEKTENVNEYYVSLDNLLEFLYPRSTFHPNSTLRLFLFAEYGPLYNHHSYSECLCNKCKQKCKQLRKENNIAKQLYFNKILIGTKQLNINNNKLDFLCCKCKDHCSSIFHIKSGFKNIHIVSQSELSKMEEEIERNDLLSCFISTKEKVLNPLTIEEENELINMQPYRVKHIPKLNKKQIINILNTLTKYKIKKNENKIKNNENIKETESNISKAEIEENDDENKPVEEQSKNNDDEEELNENDTEQIKNEDTIEENDDDDDPDEYSEYLSFYDISCIVRKVRNERKNNIKNRNIYTVDNIKNGPSKRSDGINTKTLSYTNKISSFHKFNECESSAVLSSLLHSFTHQISTLNNKNKNNTSITQNARLLRNLKPDSHTNWDPNASLKHSNRLTNNNYNNNNKVNL